MKIKYQTAIATLIQFIAVVFLNIGTGAVSVVSSCHANGDDCVSNIILGLMFYMLIALWFGFVWMLGFMAQERRSKRLAQVLIVAEVLIALVALFNARHHTDPLSLITSLTDFALAIWVIILAFRLMRADGGRIVSKQHPRERSKTSV